MLSAAPALIPGMPTEDKCGSIYYIDGLSRKLNIKWIQRVIHIPVAAARRSGSDIFQD